MNNSNFFNYKKVWATLIAVGLGLSLLMAVIIINSGNAVKYYSSIQECIETEIDSELRNDHLFSNPKQAFPYKSKLISFENEKQYCEFIYH